ncbi:hypothetical protein CAPTEDRAFT_145836 [Capitella teleta]|uniref:TLDc domain-containing protein n=1 Tax=Capitella teleta TaxID=283909 RepID=X1Z4D8_CAPTE|nr:hypothetical protein CAPTEDRAFT_145836 [Capitella teleta]|eukprot:ELU00245.1 hypothetical protein CAPTEDRAFT_145836 [Capitella teleta]
MAAPFSSFVDRQFSPSISSAVSTKTKSESSSQELDDVLRSRDVKRLKVLLRSSSWTASDPIRAELWHKICCSLHKDVARGISIYPDLVTRVFGEDTAHDATLPPFIDISTLEHYHLTQAGVRVARRIVCILEQECPDITYSPALFAITCLLLHYMHEEDAYNALCAMLKSKEKYLTQTKISHDATKYMLKELAKKHAKACYQFMQKLKVPMENVLSRWLWWIFHDLPFHYLVRIVDCFLLEGPKVLLRVALAILQLYHKSQSKNSQLDTDVSRAISSFCEDIAGTVSVDKFLKVAFGIRGLSRKALAKLRIKQEMIVQSRINVSSMQSSMPLSPSVDSLSLKVVRSHSGPINVQDINSTLLNLEQQGLPARAPWVLPFANKCYYFVQWHDIFAWLPARWSLLQPHLLFSTSEHGTSLQTFFNKVDGYEPILIVIRTINGEVFGAFCSMDWATRKEQDRTMSYFGNGETFVFSFTGGHPRKFDWVGKLLKEKTPRGCELFMAGDLTRLNIGGGGGVAISLDENLNMGQSEKCDTFQSPPLVEGHYFQCGTVEAYSFESK